MYAGSWAGVWRSDDGGEIWSQLTRPQPTLEVQGDIAGALYSPHIFDLAASPTDANLVLASALDSQYADGRDGIYRSTDGGSTWTLVMKSAVPCNIDFAPDDPQLVYAVTTQMTSATPPRTFGVVATSRDAGASWTTQSLRLDTTLWHVAVGPMEADGTRRVYALGDKVVWYSRDGGHTWTKDLGVTPQLIDARNVLANFQARLRR